MQFKFDANQEFQTRAIEAVTDLFEGQPRVEVELTFALGGGFAAVGNRLDLDEEALLGNLRAVQERNGVTQDDALQCIEDRIETADGEKEVRFANFSVEMETGTGKTYVYLRTALELSRRYGERKFIVVVPSVAIREGVLKTLQMTEKHFRELYSNLPYRYYAYASDSLSQVRSFALSDGVEIMVMTLDAFNKAANIIRQSTDKLQGETPIYLVQATRPILILDEPQNMESEKSIAALATLNPLFALRYSATHRNPYNVVYRLSPFEAYRQRLVKRIEVASLVKEGDFNEAFLQLNEVRTEKNTITARLAVHKLMKDGTVKEKVVTVRPGDSLEEKTGRREYAGLKVEEIDAGWGLVRFANDVELRKGESRGADKESIFAEQIRYTVEQHFRRQAQVKAQGVKVLSLFFIDRVANYRTPEGGEGLIRNLFDRAFAEVKGRYGDWLDCGPAGVQAAYFAESRRRSGERVFEDSVTGTSQKDERAYDLIMKDKERLLSFDEPVSFIFSHSALREGWDNPNIFQICTLNQSVSEIKKRQEVGRGARLAVNQGGDRVRDEAVNVLTVVANESYEKYVATLQQEIEDEYGIEGTPPKPANALKRATARLRKEYKFNDDFKELWERIKHKTRYAVRVDTERLISEVVGELDKAAIKPPRIRITRAQVEAEKDKDALFAKRVGEGEAPPYPLTTKLRLPNIVDTMTDLMEHTSPPPVRLSRRTLLEVFKRTMKRQDALLNPHEFATTAVRIIKEKLGDHLINGIEYEKINDWYEMTQFDDETVPWGDCLVPADHSLYDQVICESGIERKFAEELDKRGDVRLFVKLPGWFTVPTPVGEYNPDWAIVMEDRDEFGGLTDRPLLYLVRETKGTTKLSDLRPDERRKIMCGQKHFKDALDVDYKVSPNADELG